MSVTESYSDAIEMVSGKLYCVGGKVPLDGRASWAPADATGYQPVNTYLVIYDGEALVVDPGLSAAKSSVLSGLRKHLPHDLPVRVFLTRFQFDCVGNLSALTDEFAVRDIFSGGGGNPFDSFDAATSVGANPPTWLPAERSPAEAPLEVYSASLRLLATFWGYEAETKTLFTSDSFAHVTTERLSDPGLIDRPALDLATEEDLRNHLFSTFWWLPYADKQAIVEDLLNFFETHPVDFIAPGRGCVLAGEAVVARHIDMMLSVLGEAPKERL
jgi:hypothetical protein